MKNTTEVNRRIGWEKELGKSGWIRFKMENGGCANCIVNQLTNEVVWLVGWLFVATTMMQNGMMPKEIFLANSKQAKH